MTAAVLVYLTGVVVGLVCGDAQPAARMAYAVFWPLGILAFVVTLAILLIASLIAFPLFAAVLVIATVLFWALW